MNAYLKAIAPALTAIAMAVITAVNLGAFDWAALETGLVGLAAATVSFFVTNGPVGWRRYAKAIAPAVLTLVGVGVHALVTGELGDPSELRAAAAGLLAALMTLVIPNFAVAPATSGKPAATS